MGNKTNDFESNEENDKNTINKSKELEIIKDSQDLKMQDRIITNIEDTYTLYTQVSISPNKSKLGSTNEENISKEQCNMNYKENSSNIEIENIAQEESKEIANFTSDNHCTPNNIITIHEIINTSEESNKKSINIQNSSNNEFLPQESDSSESDNEADDTLWKRKTLQHHKKHVIFDSDSDEEEIKPLNENTKCIKQAPVYSINDKGNIIPETDIRSRSLGICDPESSDDESTNNYNYSEPLVETTIKKDVKKSKTIINNEDKKITGKDAAKLKKEITSESQRRTRESAVNLPYHKPKARTLKEFLQNRPRFATTIPTSTSNTPPSLAIKMSSDQLEMISEKLSEREKEVEQFFKSESESEEEEEEENKETQEKNENIKSEISEKVEHNSSENIESEHKKIVEQNANFNPEISEQNEELDKPSENRITILQNVLLNSNVHVENEIDETFQSEYCHPPEQVEQANTEAATKISDGDTSEFETNQVVIKSNENDKMELGNQNKNPDSPQYEFTLDDVSFEEDENEEIPNLETDTLNKLIDKYTSEETTNEVANIPVNLEECNKEVFVEQPKNTSLLNMIEFSSTKPELKGSPGLVIDLEDGSTKLSEVSQLMNRFLRHNKKKTPQKNKVKLDIISISSGEIHKETVELSTDEKETIAINEKPGERLKKLRNELETQMAQRRSQLWLQKSNLKLKSEENERKDDAHIESNGDNDILDDEDEGEFTNSEEEEEEEDIIGGEDSNDEGIAEGEPKQKSVFLDEEAEESDLDSNDENSISADEDVIQNSEVCNNEAMDDNGDENNHQSQNDEEGKKEKKLKRIIKPFLNDSDDEQSSLDNIVESKLEKLDSSTTNPGTNKEYVLDSTDTWDDSDPTPHQPRNLCTPSKKQTQSKSELGFLTPVVQLTGLQSLNSGSKFLHESPISPFVMPIDSPVRSFTQNGPQKRLFTDTDLTATQEMSEVAQLCSGIFPSQTQEINGTNKSESVSENNITTSDQSEDKSFPIQDEPSTQDLLEICSGKFTGITQPDKIETNSQAKESDKVTPTKSFFDNSKPSLNVTEISISNNEVKMLDTEDKLISQLLDEEEMENFKRKFESPLNEQESSLISFPRVMYDSSDDENNFSNKGRRKRQRKLVFSDDENSNDCDKSDILEGDNEGTDFGNNIDEEEELHVSDVEYDSEENEISVNPEEKIKKIKIGDFLENEAELSESDWGSADEDEGGLDELEIEEGDKEKLDENKIKMDLERIHIRRVLDDDNEEVKLLQEFLLDDGELHGSGRERQFRWKNIDSTGNDVGALHQDEGEIYLDDENDDEEKWRKMRYEREEFLKKQLEKSQHSKIEENDGVVNTNSQVFKLGQKALKRQISNTQSSTVILERKLHPPSPEAKAPFSLLCKRGSFLTRSDRVLARVAEFTKTIAPVVGGAKKSKNFIFQTVSESTDVISLNNKRKATDGTPKAIKRLRLNNLNSATKKKDKGNGQSRETA